MDEKRCSLNPIEAKLLGIEFIRFSQPFRWVRGCYPSSRGPFRDVPRAKRRRSSRGCQLRRAVTFNAGFRVDLRACVKSSNVALNAALGEGRMKKSYSANRSHSWHSRRTGKLPNPLMQVK